MATSTSSGNSVEPATDPFTKVGTTTDTPSGRGGLALFSRYLRNVGIFEHLERLFGPLRKSAKGIPESALFHTNLGQGGEIDARLEAVGRPALTTPVRIIELHHGRGRDELVFRTLRAFRAQQLPFKRFEANAAFYYTVMVAFFLYESFKRDVSADVLPPASYPTCFRRRVLDFAARIVRTGGETILRVTEATWTRLRIAESWDRTADPPRFAGA